jgi:hypothetical protein
MGDKDYMPQHKRMAEGLGDSSHAHPARVAKFANGGKVPLKTGIPTNPITDAKRANGIPGMKRGGKC